MKEEGENKIRIYMDYAAATPVRKEAISAMSPYWSEKFGNPNSLHSVGKAAKEALEDSRKKVADVLNAKAEEVIFTGSGTEANNIAIQGVFRSALKKGVKEPHIIASAIEHSSVENVFRALDNEGARVDFCPVDENGVIKTEKLSALVCPETVLVSLMYVNNEIGTIEPIKEVSAFLKEKNKEIYNEILLHVDAAQAPLYLSLDVGELGVDLLSVDGQKIYGPKGAGALYVRSGTKIEPIFYGGGQEKKLRPATQNVALIVGLAEALSLASEEREWESKRLREIQKYFLEKLEKELPEALINGSKDPKLRTPNNVNISIPGVEGDYLLALLDKEGILVSSVSACHSGNTKGSHVVRAISGDGERAVGAVRFSMGKDTTKGDIDFVIEKLKKIIKTLDF